jgi:hypothetical protein
MLLRDEACRLAQRLAWEVLDAWRATAGDANFPVEAAEPGTPPLTPAAAAMVDEEYRAIADRLRAAAAGAGGSG